MKDRSPPMHPVHEPLASATEASTAALVGEFRPVMQAIRSEVGKVVIGQSEVVDQLLITLLVGAHCLITGMPGTAKTLLVRTLAQALGLTFRRIQFTPDLLPSDVVGTMVFSPKDGAFTPHRGPIFANLVLADEINRAPAKVQSALLEAMQERQVTIGDTTYPLPDPFLVLATQNPIEQEGTYNLPEAQVDRFMFNLRVDYPTRADEIQILQETTRDGAPDLKKVLTGDDLLALQSCVRQIPVPPSGAEYAVDLVQSTRPKGGTSPDYIQRYVQWGAGPRASQYLALAGKALAVLDGRFNVAREDVAASAKLVLRHRIIINYRAEADGVSVDDLIDRLLALKK